MVKEAADHLNRKMNFSDINEYIEKKYGEVNENTLRATITLCTVNHSSRIHYPENKKARLAKGNYDFLYQVDRGIFVPYDLEVHGLWEIYENKYGKLDIRQSGIEDREEEEDIEMIFPLEDHLRDFIVKNIDSIKINGKRIKLFEDETGRKGVEYPIDVGRIDILAINEDNEYVIFELKVHKGSDKVMGQLLRYIGWIKKNLSGEKPIYGVIVAKYISKKLEYAASVLSNVHLFEYEIDFDLKKVDLT